MLRKIVRVILALSGIPLGIYLFHHLVPTFISTVGAPISVSVPAGFSAFGGALFGFIFYGIAPLIMNAVTRVFLWCDVKLKAVPTQDIVLAAFGLVVTLLIGALLSLPVYRLPVVGVFLAPAISIFLAVLGVRLVLARRDDFTFLSGIFNRTHRGAAVKPSNETYKILDTSAIIDGRIVDICKTRFLEGIIIVAGFVLEELRHIADSPDLLKRNRGRRGLDILNKIQKEMDIPVEILEKDYEDISEVDSKLVRLAKEINGKIITNDFNLNKVCELQGISVLNINELANSVKPVVLPGEEMIAQIIKDGKEAGQGVAYLDDGTMVVVEGGKKHIGETIDVLVTSVLQTAAGRMIFAKPKLQPERVPGVK